MLRTQGRMARRASNRLSIKGAPFELEPFQWMNPHIDIIMPNISAKSIPSNNQHHGGGIAPGTTAGGW